VSQYTRPTFQELNTRINADLGMVPRVLAEPLAAMWARACHGQHGYLDWILAQCSPLTCELDRLYDWAALYGVSRLLPIAARGLVLATGSVGAQVLAGSVLMADNGLSYEVISAVTLSASTSPVFVRCTRRGANTNIPSGRVLTLVDPLLGISQNMRVSTGGLSGGADDEDVEAWRLRVVDEWQAVTKYGGRSGRPSDYVAWAKAAHPSVTGALVQPHALGKGTVLVRPICNGLADRQPTGIVLNDVLAFFQSVAPATAVLHVVAPIISRISIGINLAASVDTAANRAAVQSVLDDLVASKMANRSVILVVDIDQAVMSVTSSFTRVSPATNIYADDGEVLVLNPVVFS
jgi:uncharacterized phage protein gp47/JayE